MNLITKHCCAYYRIVLHLHQVFEEQMLELYLFLQSPKCCRMCSLSSQKLRNSSINAERSIELPFHVSHVSPMSHNWTVCIPRAPAGQSCFVLLGFCHLIRLIPRLMCSTVSSWIKLMAIATHWKSKYKRRSNFTGYHLGLDGSCSHASFFCLPSSFIYPLIQSTLMFHIENQGTINQFLVSFQHPPLLYP